MSYLDGIKIVSVRTLWAGAVSLYLFGFGSGAALFYYPGRKLSEIVAGTGVFGLLAVMMFMAGKREASH